MRIWKGVRGGSIGVWDGGGVMVDEGREKMPRSPEVEACLVKVRRVGYRAS